MATEPNALEKMLGEMSKIPASGGGIYMRDGVYPLLIVKHMECVSKRSGLTFIAELYVGASQNDPSAKTGKPVRPATYSSEGSQIEANPPGSTLTFLQGNLDDRNDIHKNLSFSKVKAFMLALANEPDFSETNVVAAQAYVQNCLKAWGPDQPLTGAGIRATTRRQWTKESGKLLTLPMWESLPNTDADVEANKKLLYGTSPAPNAA